MSRPRFLFRPNLQKEDHQKAWAALQAVPEGQKSEFIVRAILKSSEAELLRQIIREELATAYVQEPKESNVVEQKTAPAGMLSFLEHLLEEEKE